MEWSFFYVCYTVGDAKDDCFSSLCMGEWFRDTLFFNFEYGASLIDVANLEGMKYPHFWRCWEICGSFEVSASWDIVWVFVFVFVSSTVCSSSWTWCTILLMKYLLPKKKKKTIMCVTYWILKLYMWRSWYSSFSNYACYFCGEDCILGCRKYAIWIRRVIIYNSSCDWVMLNAPFLFQKAWK